jgi:hypothetical protein
MGRARLAAGGRGERGRAKPNARSLLVSFCVAITLLWLPSRLPAEGCLDYELYPHWIGTAGTPFAASGVAVSGDYAFVTDVAAGLLVVDTSDPASPRTVASLELPGVPEQISLSDTLLATACGDSGIAFAGVTSPLQPHLLGTIRPVDRVLDVALTGAYLFAACDSAGLAVVDASRPDAPRLVSRIDLSGSCGAVVVADGHAFVAAGAAGLHIVDVSDPAVPLWVGGLPTDHPAIDLTIVGERILLTVRNEGVLVVDRSDPANLILVTKVVTNASPYGIVASGGIACVGETLPDVIELIDLANPDAPEVKGTLNPFAVPWGMALVGGRLYVADTIGGLQMYDLPTATMPDPIGSASLAGSGRSLAALGHRAYVVGATGFQVFDITDPSSPSVLGELADGWLTGGIAIAGNHAYITSARDGFLIVDLTNPRALVLDGRLDGHSRGKSLALAGEHLFLVDQRGRGIQICDISDPRVPAIVGALDTPGTAWDVSVSGHVLYVADDDAGLTIVDISDPHSPSIIGRLDTPYRATGVAAAGDTVYLLERERGLRIVDASDPRSPHTIGGVRSPGSVRSIALAGRYAYLAADNSDLQVVDLANLTNPRSVGSPHAAWRVVGVAVAGDGVCFVTDSGLLGIYQAQCGGEVPPLVTGLDAIPLSGAIRIRWQAGVPEQTLGYVVSRAEGADPPEDSYVAIDPDRLIPGAGPWEFLDRDIDPSTTYSYRVLTMLPGEDSELSGPVSTTSSDAPPLELLNPRPNPSRGTTILRYDLPETGTARLEILDVSGRRIRSLVDGTVRWGANEENWDGRDDSGHPVASGRYFVRLAWNGRHAERTLTLLR